MRVGVLGGGQLGLMLGDAAQGFGHECHFFDPSDQACATQAGLLTVADYDNKEALQKFAAECDVVTYEFENVPLAAIDVVAEEAPVFPPRRALEVAQDRLHEKTTANNLGIAVGKFLAVNSEEDLKEGLKMNTKIVLKTRRFGYDGKGQAVVSSVEEATDLIDHGDLIAEDFIQFDREVSIIATRGQDGSMVYYPLTENTHRDGILRESWAPADASPALQKAAEEIITNLANELEYVGTLAVELFQVGDKLLFNEMAPRVHNSGHWTIEGAYTSQFENHILAVAGEPLQSTEPTGVSCMINWIGEAPQLHQWPEQVGAHLYGKDPRPGRKIGHVTITGETKDEIDALCRQLKI